MITHQAIDGPYSRWLYSVRAQLGERVWDLIQDMDGSEADAILAAKGVLSFEHSAEYARWKHYLKTDPIEMDPKAPLVLTEKMSLDDCVVQIEIEDERHSTPDPRPFVTRGENRVESEVSVFMANLDSILGLYASETRGEAMGALARGYARDLGATWGLHARFNVIRK